LELILKRNYLFKKVLRFFVLNISSHFIGSNSIKPDSWEQQTQIIFTFKKKTNNY
jgi:hypothetical protein